MFKDIVELFNGESQRKSERRVAYGTSLGFVGGLLFGALLGILFAPQSGDKTRKDIADTAERSFKGAKEKASELGGKFSEATSKLTTKVSDTYNEFKESVEDAKDQRKVNRIARRNQRDQANDSHPVAASAPVVSSDE